MPKLDVFGIFEDQISLYSKNKLHFSVNLTFPENPLSGIQVLQYCLLCKIIIPLIRNEFGEGIPGHLEAIYEDSEYITDVIRNFKNTYFTALQL